MDMPRSERSGTKNMGNEYSSPSVDMSPGRTGRPVASRWKQPRCISDKGR